MSESDPASAPTPACTTGQRVAGALLIAHALMNLVEAFMMPDDMGPQRAPITVILDLVIGPTLLANNPRLLQLAFVRVAIGLVLHVGLPLTRGELLLAIYQALWNASLLLLLIGTARRLRIAAASLLFAGYAVMEGMAIHGLATGRNLFTRLEYALGREVEAAPAELAGIASDYRLHVPSDRWLLRTADAARRDNPDVDRWLVRPDLDAHIIVIDEMAPGVTPDLDQLTAVVIDNVREGTTRFTDHGTTPLRQYPDDGHLLRLSLRTGGLDLAYHIGVITAPGRGYQIMGFAPQSSIAEASADLESIIESFRLPTDPP